MTRGSSSLTIYAPFLNEVGESERHAADPALRSLLCRARRAPCDFPDQHERLWELLLETPPGGDAPFAAVMRVGDGVMAEARYWLCADPVSLSADLTTVRLLDSRSFALDEAEADALLAILNAELGEPGWRLYRGRSPRRWYLGIDEALAVSAPSPQRVAASDFDASLPRGRDAMRVRRWLNDAQMILHAAPVNAARERRGALQVNGIWFWGGGAAGRAEDPGTPAGERVLLASDPLSVGLATRLAWPMTALPEVSAFGAILRQHAGRELLAVLVPDAMPRATPLAYLAALAPVLRAALRSGDIGQIFIETERERWTIGRFDALCFWRAKQRWGVDGG